MLSLCGRCRSPSEPAPQVSASQPLLSCPAAQVGQDGQSPPELGIPLPPGWLALSRAGFVNNGVLPLFQNGSFPPPLDAWRGESHGTVGSLGLPRRSSYPSGLPTVSLRWFILLLGSLPGSTSCRTCCPGNFDPLYSPAGLPSSGSSGLPCELTSPRDRSLFILE